MCNRPAIASTSAPVRITPSIGDDRRPLLGWRIAWAWICSRKSGEALIRNQRSPSPLTASEAWVRRFAPGSPERARRQPSAFEFHCGKPPPAAAPNTTALTAASYGQLRPPGAPPRGPVQSRLRGLFLEVGAGVGVDFHADSDLDDTRFLPSHWPSPSKRAGKDADEQPRVSRPRGSRLMGKVGREDLDVLVLQRD